MAILNSIRNDDAAMDAALLEALSPEQRALFETMRAERDAAKDRLRKASTRRLTLKVSSKGAVSVYGMGKFPITLYAEQWGRLLDMADDIRQFLTDNADTLSVKE